MAYGYSLRLVKLNRAADSSMLGVRLGRACIKHDVSVVEVANALNVTRQTIYNWFCGDSAPQDSVAGDVEAYIEALSALDPA